MSEIMYANSGISADKRSADLNDSFGDIYENTDEWKTRMTGSCNQSMTSGTVHIQTVYIYKWFVLASALLY